MMVKRTLSVFISVLLVLSLCQVIFADIPAGDNYFNDFADVLTDETENSIKSISDSLYKSRSSRIAVCTVKSTGDKSIGEYASEVFDAWKIGHGVLILVATDDGDYYAIQSKSVSDVLNNTKLSEILKTQFESYFAAGEYDGGLVTLVNYLSSYLTSNLKEDFGKSGGLPGPVKIILRIILIIAVILIAGYIVLVIAEKRQAEKKRQIMEMRRRELASRGRSGSQRRNYQSYRQHYADDNSESSVRASGYYGSPGQGYRGRQGRSSRYQTGSTQAGRTAGNPRYNAVQYPSGRSDDANDPLNAKTVQISREELRAAARRKSSDKYR